MKTYSLRRNRLKTITVTVLNDGESVALDLSADFGFGKDNSYGSRRRLAYALMRDALPWKGVERTADDITRDAFAAKAFADEILKGISDDEFAITDGEIREWAAEGGML